MTGVFNNGLIVNGRPVLTSDHKADENAHPFYLNPKGYKTLQTTGTQAGDWAKICTITIQDQFKLFEAKISFMSGIATSNTQRGEWFVKIIQNTELGTVPAIRSRLKGYSYISVDQVKAVIVQNDTVQTKVELYIKVNTAFDEMYFNPYHCVFHEKSMFVRWWKDTDPDNLGFIPSLPAGTAIDALEDISFSRATNTTNGSAQSVTAATWTKVIYKTELNDYKSEYDDVNSRFIPNQNGVYEFHSAVRMTSPSTANFRSLGLYVNGALVARMANSNGPFLMGTISYPLRAFDTAEIYIYSADAVTLEQNATDAYFMVKSK